MQVYENSKMHCRGHTNKRGHLPFGIKYGTYIQLVGTHSDCHSVKLRKADKFTRPPEKETKVITLVRRPAHGDPYALRFVLPETNDADDYDNLLREWLLPRIRERQRAVARRKGFHEDHVDPLHNSASTSHDGAGGFLKAVRKWMATTYKDDEGKWSMHVYMYVLNQTSRTNS